MSATTAVKETARGRLGVMVRTATELYVYWKSREAGLTLRVTDLTGRPPAELLDGVGSRELPAAPSVYVPNLQPGHLYYVDVGLREAGGFVPVAGAGPVQTPWLPAEDHAACPAPYHRS